MKGESNLLGCFRDKVIHINMQAYIQTVFSLTCQEEEVWPTSNA